jgi:hypothetical protein
MEYVAKQFKDEYGKHGLDISRGCLCSSETPVPVY